MNRFQRTEMLIGAEALSKLANSAVAVFGVGGVGSFVIEALARAGIGKLRIVDHDVVDVTNINRQLHALDSTVGKPKAFLMAERVTQINPDCRIEPIKEYYSSENSSRLLSGQWDFVVDAIDSIRSKIHLLDQCLKRKIPVISSMGAGNRLDPTSFRMADISETHTCPLAKMVRKELRQLGWEKGLKVVFSPERPQSTGGRVPGSISFVPPAAGLVIASHVVRSLIEDTSHVRDINTVQSDGKDEGPIRGGHNSGAF